MYPVTPPRGIPAVRPAHPDRSGPIDRTRPVPRRDPIDRTGPVDRSGPVGGRGWGGPPGGGTPTWGTRRGPTVPYIPALDGLRALAVIAVIVYHANPSWLGGGFLGVEVFFVISGYLITLLLVAEHERSGTVSLGNFWRRRARRLLPALAVLMLGIILWSALFDPDRLGMLRGDVVSGLGYVANWFQVWTGSSYTSASAFAPLRHLWSLAVEEQFYVFWPVVMFAILRRVRPSGQPVVGLWFGGLALLVTAVNAVLFVPGRAIDPVETPSQYISLFGREVLRTDLIYLSTPTRMSGLLLGAGLAMLWRPWKLSRGRVVQATNTLDLVGVAGIAMLAFLASWVHMTRFVTDVGAVPVDFLYRGGLLVTGVATLTVIAAVTNPASLLGRYVLGNPVFVWIGTRSYGLYLYHWTVFQVFRTNAGNALTGREFVGCMLISGGLTELSYRFVEKPVRDGRAAEMLRGLRAAGGQSLAPLMVAGLVLLVPAWAVARMTTAEVIPDDITASLEANETTVPSTVPGATTTVDPAAKVDVFAIGDSVMLGAAKRLEAQGITVDARRDRQFFDALQSFNYLKARNSFGSAVVIHLGTNGPTSAEAIERVFEPLKEVPRVVVVNLQVPSTGDKGYIEANNALFAGLRDLYPNVRVLDWKKISAGRTTWFASDGFHLTSEGAAYYVDYVLRALNRPRPPIVFSTTTTTTEG